MTPGGAALSLHADETPPPPAHGGGAGPLWRSHSPRCERQPPPAALPSRGALVSSTLHAAQHSRALATDPASAEMGEATAAAVRARVRLLETRREQCVRRADYADAQRCVDRIAALEQRYAALLRPPPPAARLEKLMERSQHRQRQLQLKHASRAASSAQGRAPSRGRRGGTGRAAVAAFDADTAATLSAMRARHAQELEVEAAAIGAAMLARRRHPTAAALELERTLQRLVRARHYAEAARVQAQLVAQEAADRRRWEDACGRERDAKLAALARAALREQEQYEVERRRTRLALC